MFRNLSEAYRYYRKNGYSASEAMQMAKQYMESGAEQSEQNQARMRQKSEREHVAALCDGRTTMRAFAHRVLDGCGDGYVDRANDYLDAVASRCGLSDVLEAVREDFIADSDAENNAAYMEALERANLGTEPNRSR